jgi:hypothetical protein
MKLTDTQLVMLSAASQRVDRALEGPAKPSYRWISKFAFQIAYEPVSPCLGVNLHPQIINAI